MIESTRHNPSRNAACPCNSGLRYKHCCGLPDNGAASTSARHDRKRDAGLRLQERGELVAAIEAYDAVLREHREDWDVAHMRATCLYQLGAMDDARAAFAALVATPAADIPHFWTNLGLVLAATCGDHSSPSLRERIVAYRRFRPGPPAPARMQGPMPTVSVVMPAYMHASYAGEAIASVIAQTRPPLEMIVIDDGSSDATAECCRTALAHAPFPVRFIARENRGASATLNQAIDLAQGEFIQLLNSDDRLPPERISAMLAALLPREADWGYARVSMIDANGSPLRHQADARASIAMEAQDAALMSHSLGLAFLRANPAISSGNLMLRKRLWKSLGGFRDYRYNHDWDFCLRATLESEPVLVPERLYDYRIHGRNTIGEAATVVRAEAHRVMADFVGYAHGRCDWPNPFAPTLGNWGGEVLALLGATDAVRHLPRARLEQALSTATGG
jgi:glycosyltransferase involved in cell wall biosynthesis